MYEDFSPLLSVLKSQHQQRVETDPDWQFMLDEIALISEQRTLKTFTLNKASREQLKEQREETWLAIENTRRQKRNEAVFESTEAVEAFRKQQKEDEQTPDPILQETTHLLADYTHAAASLETRLVRKEDVQ